MASELPLEGVRVLDLTRQVSGGFCTQLLADFGADVIEVEDAREAFPALAETADVVVEALRPGELARLGLDYETLRARNPRLVLCSISSYGQTGPDVQRAGHDLNVLARTGMLELSGELDGPPVQPAGLIAEIGGGALMAVTGILLALRERERSGEGQHVDASMFDGTLAWMAGLADRHFAGEALPERGKLDRRGGMVCYMPYPCKDGWVTLAALEEEHWVAFCRAAGREDLLEHRTDPSDGWAQGQLEALFRKRTRAEWQAFGDAHDCCLEVVATLPEALDSPLVRAREMVVELDGHRRALGVPVKLSRTPGDPRRRPAPALGD